MGINGIEKLYEDDLPKSASYDNTDVPAALARETQDGSGFESEDELPPSDFEENIDLLELKRAEDAGEICAMENKEQTVLCTFKPLHSGRHSWQTTEGE